MNNKCILSLLGMCSMLTLVTACSEEEVMKKTGPHDSSIENAGIINQALVTVSDFKPASNARTAVDMGVNKGKFSWVDNDRIGIFPTKEGETNTFKSQHVLTLMNVDEAGKAVFTPDGWTFTSGYQYIAHYPFIDLAEVEMKDIPADYSKQTYTVQNDGKVNLSATDYMVAKAVAPEQGKIPFSFNHLGCLMELSLPLPEAGTQLDSITLISESKNLILTGKYDLTQGNHAFQTLTTGNNLTIKVKGITTTQADEVVKVYFMMPPAQLQNKTMILETNVTGAKQPSNRVVTFKGNLEAEKYYMLTAEDAKNYITIDPINHSITTKIPELIDNQAVTEALNGGIALKVSGPINGTDLRALRKAVFNKLINELDLEDAQIKAGGKAYNTKNERNDEQWSEDNTLGKFLFAEAYELTKLVLPKDLIKIDDNAIKNAKIKELHFPSTLKTIGEAALMGNKQLQSIDFPKNVESLGEACLHGCENLESITFDQESPITILPKRFCTSCPKITSITFPPQLKIIKERALERFNGTTLTLPETLEVIENNAISAIGMTELTIPASVDSIGRSGILCGSKLKKLIIEGEKGNRKFNNEIAFSIYQDNVDLNLIIDPSWKEDITLQWGSLFFHSTNWFKSIKDKNGNDLIKVNPNPDIDPWNPGTDENVEAE